MAVPSLCCFVRAVFSCGEWGLLELHCAASQCGGFSCEAQALGVQLCAHRRLCATTVFRSCRTQPQQLQLAGSRAHAQLWRMGLVALQHTESSWTRDQTLWQADSYLLHQQGSPRTLSSTSPQCEFLVSLPFLFKDFRICHLFCLYAQTILQHPFQLLELFFFFSGLCGFKDQKFN